MEEKIGEEGEQVGGSETIKRVGAHGLELSCP